MQVTLAGLGCGTADTITEEVREALKRADAVIGSARLLNVLRGLLAEGKPLLETYPEVYPEIYPEVRPKEIVRLLAERNWARPCVVYSGDSGFYSGARILLPLLEERGISFRILPGVSSVQALSARIGRPWQDWKLYSAHGVDCDPVGAISQGKPAFFLTGNRGQSPAALCQAWTDAGLGNLPVTIGENLTCPDERITRVTAAEAAKMDFSPLSVLLAEAAPVPYPVRTPGIPDGEFLRDR